MRNTDALLVGVRCRRGTPPDYSGRRHRDPPPDPLVGSWCNQSTATASIANAPVCERPSRYPAIDEMQLTVVPSVATTV